jgi:isoquinoline 1-oxidoreductase beta subunit
MATVILPKTEMGQGVYTSIPMLVAEELDLPLARVKVEIPQGDPGRFGSLGQETGGSTSTRETWKPVRTAAASVREMLVAAAARSWSVDPASCITRDGKVAHTRSGRRIDYGALAEIAAGLPVPVAPRLKEPGEYRLLGKSAHRLDSAPKTDGTAVYGIDVRMPGMLVAVLAQSPVIGGVLASVDERAARAVGGVRHIVKLKDAVAVVGDHTWAAKAGLEALDPQWEGGETGLGQAVITTALRDALAKPGQEAGKRGDPEAAMARAARRVEAVYEQPFLAHATMEPTNCTAHVTDAFCHVWLGSQVPDEAKKVAASASGLPLDKVTVHNFLMGGGFGRRLEADMVERAVAVAKGVGAPVKLIWNREEDLQHDRYRPAYADRIAAGLDAGGRPIAWTHRIAGSSIIARLYPRAFKGVDGDAVECSVETPYRLPDARVEYTRQESPVTTSWWRGVGPLRSIFVVESFIDELAASAGVDPVAYRMGLLDDPRAKQVLALAADKAGWRKAPPGRFQGVSLLHAWDTYMAQVAEIEMRPDGLPSVKRVTVAIDCGQPINPNGIRAQMEGGVIFGLSAALFGEITFAGGRVEQSNFHDYRVLRMSEAPVVDTHIVESRDVVGGVGEPPTAGIFPALTNAVFAATGRRIRSLPIAKALQA